MWKSALLALQVVAAVADAAVVPFTIAIERATGAPDGFERDLIVVNGTSPGPALVINQGDTVKFLVQNRMSKPTTIHFHGITQLYTPWSDGVPGLSQEPIPAGGEFLYEWTADDYGTYWYHSHELSQISDGLFGPILIRPAAGEPTPWHLISSDAADVAAMAKAARDPKLVSIADWDHVTASEKLRVARQSGYDLYCSRSILINGRGQVDCLGRKGYLSVAPQSTIEALNGQNITAQGCTPPTVESEQGNFTHHSGKLLPGIMYGCKPTTNAPTVFNVDARDGWVSFNFISASAVQNPIVNIDGHEMWIYEADGRFIRPQLVDGFPIFNGQRYAAMVRLKQGAGRSAYTMRFPNFGTNQIIFGNAVMSYAPAGVNVTGSPYSQASYTYAALPVSKAVKTLDPSTLVPFPPVRPATTADATHVVELGRLGASWKWTMSGNESYPQDAFSDAPLLFHPNSTNGRNPNLVIRTENGTWVDIVLAAFRNGGSPTQPPHSFHKHSNKAFTIGSGNGPFKWATVEEAMREVPGSFNLKNPPYRDSFITVPVGDEPTWIVVRYQSMNPGAWFMHCHIQPHLAGGMGMALLDGIDTWPTIPPRYAQGGNGM